MSRRRSTTWSSTKSTSEFNTDFDGLTTQLDYVKGLGVNVLELMPISNVKRRWSGATPLDYFAPEERLGGPVAFKRLVNAATSGASA